MHAGNIATSARLKATLRVLKDGGWHSTRAIQARTGSCAVHSDMAALPRNGIGYETRWGRGPDGGRRCYYRVTQKPVDALAAGR